MRKTSVVLQTGRATDRLTVRVIDEASRTEIVVFQLNPEDVWSFLGGAYTEVPAEITEHFDRVGKTMVTDSVIYSQHDLKAYAHDDQVTGAEIMAKADRPGWDVYSGHRRGGYGGVQVVMRRWEA